MLLANGDDRAGAGRQVAGECPSAPPRRQYPLQFKLQVVRQTLEPGASVSIVARQHNINSNVVFRWRKEYREGKLGETTAAAFLPIQVLNDAPLPALAPSEKPGTKQSAKPPQKKAGIMAITLPGGFTVRVDADIDDAALRRALRAVRDLA